MIPAGNYAALTGGGVGSYTPPMTNPAVAAGDLSGLPIFQLSGLAQNSNNPALRAAALQEIANRAVPAGSGPGNATLASALSGQPSTPLGQVAIGAATAPGQIGTVPVGGPQGPEGAATMPPSGPTDMPRGEPTVGSDLIGPVMSGPSGPSVPGGPGGGPAVNPALSSISSGAAAAAGTAAAVPDSTGGDESSNISIPGIVSPAAANVPGLSNLPTDLTTRDKLLALSRGFFTMAASRAPSFLGALGEGGNAATQALQQASDQALKNRIFGIDTTQRQQQINQQGAYEQNASQEGNVRNQIAQQELKDAQTSFNFEKQKYEQGLGNENALKLAQIRLVNAQTAAAEASAAYTQEGRGQLVTGADGNTYRVSGATAVPVMTPTGQLQQPTLVGAPARTTAGVQTLKWITQNIAGGDPAKAYQIYNTGKAMAPDRRAVYAAQIVSQSAIPLPPAGQQAAAQALLQQWAAEDQSAGVLSGTPIPAPAPAASSSSIAIGTTATNPQTGQKIKWDGQKWVPAQ